MSKFKGLVNSVLERNEYKRKFKIWELYRSFVFVPRAIGILSQNKKSNLIDQKFIERLQLAVTEVNGCAACSYQHTQMALELGLSNEEINSFLSGGDSYIQEEEAKAILFAQHFADSRGIPQKSAYASVVNEYDEKRAEIILAACQIMIAGNMYGIPFSAFVSRLKGKKYKESSLFYELTMLLLGVLFLPIAILHSYFRALIGLSNVKFSKV